MESGNLNDRPEVIAKAVRNNIEMMARLEQEFIDRRTLSDRVTDLIAGFAGDLRFVILQVLIFGLWIVINLKWIPWIPAFDPYPFMLLAMTVSLEAIFLSTFVLMKQNRMSKRADQRANLDLQINMLAEREMTLVLQMLQRIATRLGVRLSGEEIEELSEETPIEALASELREKLPGE
ncbi:MAG TPA: DUF1003 domain-containing protein [Bryobacteraceae bacterium]|nr:DUF1003 domain-containing protein [Bryobacteraceae bacterium]